MLVIFLLPAQRLGDAHPEPGAADVDRRHVRGDVRCCGYSLDNLSLMALTLSVGFVVDDAIVMLENIVRHMEMGEAADARRRSTDRARSRFTIVSMTLSLAAVFIPILFMGGIVGRLMHEFAVTIAAAILVSGFVSLTLTPMLCSRFLKPLAEARHGRIYQWIERTFDAWLRAYALDAAGSRIRVTAGDAWRRRCCCWRRRSISSWRFPKGFIPSQDIGQLNGQTEAVQGIGFDSMVAHQRQVADIIQRRPERRAR